MSDSKLNDDEFTRACRDYRESLNGSLISPGCLGWLNVIAVLAVTITFLMGFPKAAIVLLMISLPLFMFGFGLLLYWFLCDPPLKRVTLMIDAYVESQLEWVDCSNYAMLIACGLPSSYICQVWVNLDSREFSVVEKIDPEEWIKEAENLTFENAAGVANGVIEELEFEDLKKAVSGCAREGTFSLQSSENICDGLGFTLEVRREGQKRVCQGNLSGLTREEMKMDEVQTALKLYAIADPKMQGVIQL